MIESAFMGEIRLFCGAAPPRGWKVCDGQLLNIHEYTELYVLIQTTYGGDDVTTFGLPDLRGRVPVQWSPSIHLGSPGGAEQVTLRPDHLPAHSHTLSVETADATDTDPDPGTAKAVKQLAQPGGALALFSSESPATPFAQDALALGPGGGQPHENMPPFTVAGMYIICVDGMMPPQPGESA